MNLKKILFFLIFIFSQTFLGNYWFEVTPLENILYAHPEIEYIPCLQKISETFKIPPFHDSEILHPTKVTFDETFILKIPNGKTYSHYGWIIIDNKFPKELIWKKMDWNLCYAEPVTDYNFKKIPGRVAVLGQLAFFNYYHWINEILARLALLDIFNVEYDYIYVPANSKFMIETLKLWGIDERKIILPYNEMYAIEAEELIVPSMVTNFTFEHPTHTCFSSYSNTMLCKYVRNKLLKKAQEHPSNKKFNKRFYTSRKDSALRKIVNEQELIELLKRYDIDSYNLSELSVVEQIELFNNAELILGPHGANLTNIIFCNPGTIIIELLQCFNQTQPFFTSQIFDLRHFRIKTTDFIWKYDDINVESSIPLNLIENILENMKCFVKQA
jgi:hypothetical protein